VVAAAAATAAASLVSGLLGEAENSPPVGSNSLFALIIRQTEHRNPFAVNK
jgi:hypothetical protein